MKEKIKEALSDLMPVYDPGVHVGEVKASYAVVIDMGVKEQEQTKGMLGQRILEIVLIVPLNKQNELDICAKKVQKKLKTINNLKFTGSSEASSVLQEYKGAAKSLIYRQPVRMV